MAVTAFRSLSVMPLAHRHVIEQEELLTMYYGLLNDLLSFK